MKRLSEEALSVLSAEVEVRGSSVVITAGQLDRKLYVEVNAALEAIGGTWNRKARAHLFERDPSEALAEVLVDGGFTDKKRDFDQFDTPASLAQQVVELADVHGRRVLEPSAGNGALMLAAVAAGAEHVTCVEIDPERDDVLQKLGRAAGGSVSVYKHDFLSDKNWNPFDRVVMNPPFSKQKDIEHVTHAAKFLKVGGRLVAIMSAGVTFRQDRKARAFRDLVDSWGGSIDALPEKAFRDSGTDVRAVVVVMTRPR